MRSERDQRHFGLGSECARDKDGLVELPAQPFQPADQIDGGGPPICGAGGIALDAPGARATRPCHEVPAHWKRQHLCSVDVCAPHLLDPGTDAKVTDSIRQRPATLVDRVASLDAAQYV